MPLSQNFFLHVLSKGSGLVDVAVEGGVREVDVCERREEPSEHEGVQIGVYNACRSGTRKQSVLHWLG